MADLSSVVSFFAFWCPGSGASVVLGFRGPGRLGAAGFEELVEAVGGVEVLATGGVDVDADRAGSVFSVFAVNCIGGDGGELYRGHFFASTESSGTSVTSLPTRCTGRPSGPNYAT